MILLEFALVLLLVAWLGRWVLSGVTGRGAAQLDPAHTAELARLREEVDQLTAQVGQLQEEQSFTMRLLAAGRAAPEAALPAGDETTTDTEKP